MQNNPLYSPLQRGLAHDPVWILDLLDEDVRKSQAPATDRARSPAKPGVGQGASTVSVVRVPGYPSQPCIRLLQHEQLTQLQDVDSIFITIYVDAEMLDLIRYIDNDTANRYCCHTFVHSDFCNTLQFSAATFAHHLSTW